MRPTAILVAVLLAGCASAGPPPAPRPASTPAGATDAEPVPVDPVLSPEPDLAEVLYHAERVPLLDVSRAAIAREEAAREQAGYWPNPKIGLKAERIDLSQASEGANLWKVILAQRFETAGKRGARVDAAGSRIEEAVGRERWERLRVARAAAGAHQRAVAGRRLVAIGEEALAAAEALHALAESRVRAGRESETVLPALAARVGRLSVDLEATRLLERRALRDLEGILAVEPGTIEGVSGGLLTDAVPMDSGDLADNPEVATLTAAERAARSRTDEADAEAWPDLTVGVEYEEGSFKGEEFARTVSLFLEFPLPLFDRNQGGKAAARADVRGAEAATREARARIAADYREAREVVIALAANRRTFSETVLPALERDRDLADVAYRAGRTDREATFAATLAVLGARSELTAIESTLADAILDALALRGAAPASWLEH